MEKILSVYKFYEHNQKSSRLTDNIHTYTHTCVGKGAPIKRLETLQDNS